MKRVLPLLLLFLPLLCMAQEKAPKMVISELTYDAGEVIKGTVIEHDFIVKNEGDAVLQIKSAKPG